MWLRDIGLAIVMSAMFGASADAADSCPNVLTLKALLNDAKQHHGRRVCVAGILNIEFEGNALIWDRQHVWLEFYHGPPWTEGGD